MDVMRGEPLGFSPGRGSACSGIVRDRDAHEAGEWKLLSFSFCCSSSAGRTQKTVWEGGRGFLFLEGMDTEEERLRLLLRRESFPLLMSAAAEAEGEGEGEERSFAIAASLSKMLTVWPVWYVCMHMSVYVYL